MANVVLTSMAGKELVLCDTCSARYVGDFDPSVATEVAPLSEASETSADGAALTVCVHHPTAVLTDGICPVCSAPRFATI